MPHPAILIVDDDPGLADMLALAMRPHGFTVRWAADGERALAIVDEAIPDAIVLDVMMPGIDGFEVCRRLRAQQYQRPILMLTSRNDEVDKILGLELGADDYVTKPFSARELVARIRSALRRTQRASDAAELRCAGPLAIDRARREVRFHGRPIELTATELDLLWALVVADGRALGREILVEAVYGPDIAVSERTIDTFIKRIRAKLLLADPSFDALETVRAVGYRYRQ